MIGLLQSGTGIGRGTNPPSFARGLLDGRDAARGREIGVCIERVAICVEATSRAPPPGRAPVIGRPPRADEFRRARAPPPPRRRTCAETRGGCTVLLEIRGAGRTLAEVAGVVPPGTGAVTELAVLPAEAGSELAAAAGCPAPRCGVPARLDPDSPPEDFSEEPLPRECRPSFVPSPCEVPSEDPFPEECSFCEPSPWDPPPRECRPSLEPSPCEVLSEDPSLPECRPSLEPSPCEVLSEGPALPERRPSFEPSPCEVVSEDPALPECRPSFEPSPREALPEDPSPREGDPSWGPSPCEWC